MLDADFDPAVLQHVTALKLNEEEVEALGGEERVAELGVPELLLTHGSTGCVLLARGVREHIPVRPILTSNPTGAGDAFLAGYVWARAAGHRPASAARHAATTAARVLELALACDPARSCVIATRRSRAYVELDVESEDVLGAVDVRRRARAARARAAAARRGGGERRDRRRARRPAAAAPDLGRRRRDLARGGRRAAPGFDVAVDPSDPDRVLYAARNRLHLSTDGGLFWRSLDARAARTSRPLA